MFLQGHSEKGARGAINLLALGLGAVCFGFIPYFSKLGFAEGLSPSLAVILRYCLPAILLAPYLPQALKKGTGGRQYMLFGAIMGIGAWSYFFALSILPIYLAASLFFSYPAFLVLMRVALGTPLSKRDGLTLLLVSFGLGLVLAGARLEDLHITGLLVGLIGPVCYCGLQLLSRRAPTYLPSLAMAACIFVGAVVINVPLLFVDQITIAGPEMNLSLTTLLGLAIVAGVLPQVLLAFGSSDRSGRKTAYTTGLIEFGMALLLGALVFAEVISGVQDLGFVALLAALFLTSEPTRLPRYLQD